MYLDNFKPGKWLTCVNNEGVEALTLWKIYQVADYDEHRHMVRVHGIGWYMDANRFIRA